MSGRNSATGWGNSRFHHLRSAPAGTMPSRVPGVKGGAGPRGAGASGVCPGGGFQAGGRGELGALSSTQNVQWPLWPTKKLMESQVGFAMPGIGFAGPGALFGKAAQIGRFFFCLKKPAALTKYVVGADKNSHWHWRCYLSCTFPYSG